MKKCIVCGQFNNRVIFNEFGVDILRCCNCGHAFSSYETNQNNDAYFENEIGGGDHYWWNEAHDRMYNDFCNKFIVNKKGKLLDVGCGLGYFVKKISTFSNWEVYGYEISKPAVEFAKLKLKLDNVFCGQVESSNFPKKYFNIITLWDVIEHIPDPGLILSYLCSILKDDGILFIHTPNIKIQLFKAKIKRLFFGMKKNKHYLEAKDHINIYSQQTMIKVLNKYGFKKIEFIHIHPIQSVSGSKKKALKITKNLWFYSAKMLYYITFRRVNLNNLFVIVRK
ncbi:MAG: class I SAM-dependent methyltransferase [Patescibacteria group bacterium]